MAIMQTSIRMRRRIQAIWHTIIILQRKDTNDLFHIFEKRKKDESVRTRRIKIQTDTDMRDQYQF